MTETSGSPRAVEGTSDDEGRYSRVDFDSSGGWRSELGAIVIALGLHAFFGVNAATNLIDMSDFAQAIMSAVDARLAATVDIEEPEPEKEPEPEPEPEEEPPEEELPVEPEEVVAPAEEEAPPAAAEAGKVLTSEPDPNEPLDLTADGFLSGTGTRFAGGVTAATGTSDKAVRNRAASGNGVKGSQGKKEGPTGPPPVDKSRPAGIPKTANWASCGFPPEADAENMNQAFVRVVVVVDPSGKPTSVNVLSDPGFGFGRLARQCALRFEYPVGLDKSGNPKASATPPFNIRFTR
jgi:protein TonB